MRKGWCLAALGALLTGVGAGRAQEGVVFRYRFEPGTIWLYKLSAEMEGNLQMPNPQAPATPVTLPMQMQLNAEVRQRVAETKAETGQARVAVQMPSMQMSMKMMGVLTEVLMGKEGVQIRVNGQPQPAPPNLPKEMPLLQKPLHLEVLPTGKVVEMERFPLPAGLLGPGALPALENLQAFQPQQWFIEFPERALRVGDTWEQEREIPMLPGAPPLRFKVQYKFDGWENVHNTQCARVLVTGSVEAKDLKFQAQGPLAVRWAAYQPEAPPPPAPQPPLLPTIRSLRQTFEGPLFFNLEAGRLEQMKMSLKVDMEMEIPLPQAPLIMTLGLSARAQMDLAEVRQE